MHNDSWTWWRIDTVRDDECVWLAAGDTDEVGGIWRDCVVIGRLAATRHWPDARQKVAIIFQRAQSLYWSVSAAAADAADDDVSDNFGCSNILVSHSCCAVVIASNVEIVSSTYDI